MTGRRTLATKIGPLPSLGLRDHQYLDLSLLYFYCQPGLGGYVLHHRLSVPVLRAFRIGDRRAAIEVPSHFFRSTMDLADCDLALDKTLDMGGHFLEGTAPTAPRVRSPTPVKLSF